MSDITLVSMHIAPGHDPEESPNCCLQTGKRAIKGAVKELSIKDAKHGEISTRDAPPKRSSPVLATRPLTIHREAGAGDMLQVLNSRWSLHKACILKLFHKHKKTVFSALLAGGAVRTSTRAIHPYIHGRQLQGCAPA